MKQESLPECIDFYKEIARDYLPYWFTSWSLASLKGKTRKYKSSYQLALHKSKTDIEHSLNSETRFFYDKNLRGRKRLALFLNNEWQALI